MSLCCTCLYQDLTNKTHSSTHTHTQVIVKYQAWLVPWHELRKILNSVFKIQKALSAGGWCPGRWETDVETGAGGREEWRCVWLRCKCVEELSPWAWSELLIDIKNKKEKNKPESHKSTGTCRGDLDSSLQSAKWQWNVLAGTRGQSSVSLLLKRNKMFRKYLFLTKGFSISW